MDQGSEGSLTLSDGNHGAGLNPRYPTDITASIEHYLGSMTGDIESGHIAIYFSDMNDPAGSEVTINGDERYSPASLMKVPVLMSYLKAAETDTKLLQKEILFDRNHYIIPYHQNIVPSLDLEDSRTYTIKQLLAYMIIDSSNDALVVLCRHISKDRILSTFTGLGIALPPLNDGRFDNNMEVSDFAVFFRALYDASYLTKADSQWALALLTKTQFKDGIRAGVPNDILIAHKFGERGIIREDGTEEKQLHECGIVYDPDHPYLLCIMTRGDDRKSLASTIKDISALIYQQLHSDPI